MVTELLEFSELPGIGYNPTTKILYIDAKKFRNNYVSGDDTVPKGAIVCYVKRLWAKCMPHREVRGYCIKGGK